MPGVKTNERPGTKAVLRHCRMSATKVRQVLDLIRGEDVDRAAEVLRTTPREAAAVIAKVLASAVANAAHNDDYDPDELYVASCFADEGATLKRWRPRARGRATRIRKRTCHITVVVARMPEERLERRRVQRQAAGAQRSRRVAESRRRADLAGRLSRRRHAQQEAAAAAEAEAAEAAEREEELVEDAVAEGTEPDVAEPEAAEAEAEEAGTTGGEAAGAGDEDDDPTGDDAGKGE